MEKLIFHNEYLKKDYSFDSFINQLEDKSLIKILRRENYKNEDSGLSVDCGEKINVSDLVQLKIKAAKIGVFLANFVKSNLPEEQRKTLIEQISSLKIDPNSPLEMHMDKFKKLVFILNEANPLYVTFENDDNCNLKKEDFVALGANTYFFLLTKPRQTNVKIVSKDKSKSSFKQTILNIFKKDKNVPQPVIKPIEEIGGADFETYEHQVENQETAAKQPKKEVKVIELVPFKDHIADFVFFSIFCLNASFAVMVGILMMQNKNMLAIILFVLAGLFLAIFCYSIYKYMTDFKKWEFTFQKVRYPVLMSLAGIVLGCGLGFLVGYFVIKPAEEVVLDYSLCLKIGIPCSFAIMILGLAVGYVLYVIIGKIKESKQPK